MSDARVTPGGPGKPRVRLGASAAALGLLCLLGTLVASAGASRNSGPVDAGPPASFFGVVPQVRLGADDFARMRRAGIGSVRVTFHWTEIERQPGNYDWSEPDTLMRLATANGITVLPSLYGSPGWVRVLDGTDRCKQPCDTVAPASNVTRDAFARFAGAAAQRYGPGGEFWAGAGVCPPVCGVATPPCNCTVPAPIGTWQMWNEPNSSMFYAPRPDARGYARLVQLAAAAIRAEDPLARVMLGGMWGPPGAKSVVPVPRYLKRLYRIEGTAEAFDLVALHPYGPRLAHVRRQVTAARRRMARAGDSGTGIWITELGWASGGESGHRLVRTPRGQAAILRRAYGMMLAKRAAWRIEAAMWFTYRDAPAWLPNCRWCSYAGLRTSDNEAKPAWRAFARVAKR